VKHPLGAAFAFAVGGIQMNVQATELGAPKPQIRGGQGYLSFADATEP
jgi:hypothetical protein